MRSAAGLSMSRALCQRSWRSLLLSVLPRKDCLPHLAPLQKSPDDAGYFQGHGVVAVTERCGISTVTLLEVPLGLFMSSGRWLLCPRLAGWVPELREFIFSVGRKASWICLAAPFFFLRLQIWYNYPPCLAPETQSYRQWVSAWHLICLQWCFECYR